MSEYAIDIQQNHTTCIKPSDRFKKRLVNQKSYHDLFYALDDVTMQIKKAR